MSEVSATSVTGAMHRLAPGTVVDERYEIIDFLGEGGFANVYKAQHVHIKRLVALKLLDQGKIPGTCEFEQRFVREAQTAAQIDHPNVVTIHDFGFYGEKRQPYIAMELLAGHDLEDELNKNGRLAPERVIPLFVRCLEALAEAHNAGIVHKDLKPSNLFLSHVGTDREALLILDFGVASFGADSAKRLTSTGQILGTPQYLAPEYIQDQLALPTFDVYQMGLILAETLTGFPLIDAENPFQCLMAHCKANYTVPERLMASPLGPLLQCALDVDHTKRYQNAEAFRTALVEINPGTIPRLTDADLDRAVRITAAVTGNAETMAALEQFSREAEAEGPKFESRRVGDAATAPGDQVAQHLAAAGDERGIRASMASIESLEPNADSNRGLIVAIAVIAVLIGAVVAFLVIGGDGAEDPAGTEAKDDTTAEGAEAEGDGAATAGAPTDGAPTDGAAADGAGAAAGAPTDGTAEAAAGTTDGATDGTTDGTTDGATDGATDGTTAGAAAEGTDDAAEAAAETPPQPVVVTLFLASDPTGASVFRGDELIGETPTRLDLEAAEEAVVFRFEKSGYDDREESVVPKESTQVVAVLQRKRRASRRDEPKKDEPKQDEPKKDPPKDGGDGGTVMIAP